MKEIRRQGGVRVNFEEYIIDIGRRAKGASRIMVSASTDMKNNALFDMAEALINSKGTIIQANMVDMELGTQNNLSVAMLDRLMINNERIENMAQGLRNVASLKDPIGDGIKRWKTPNDLDISMIRVPLGVIGMIYESRPNVTVDAAALCLKAGNSIILRGGSEAINTNIALTKVIIKAATSSGLPEGCIQLIEMVDRELVNKLIKLNDYVDVIIPRGGASLKKAIIESATVPVIETGAGICHIYVDSDADLSMAEDIIVNAKTQRPGVCNAVETVLIHKDIASELLPRLSQSMLARSFNSMTSQAIFGRARVELFVANNGQGQRYLGALSANPDGSFNGTLTVIGLSPGMFIVATATDTTNNSSEFGPTVQIP